MVINQYIRRVPVVALNYGQHARPIAKWLTRGASGLLKWSRFPDLMDNPGLDELSGEYDLTGVGGEVE